MTRTTAAEGAAVVAVVIVILYLFLYIILLILYDPTHLCSQQSPCLGSFGQT
jgi:hypothetical protein